MVGSRDYGITAFSSVEMLINFFFVFSAKRMVNKYLYTRIKASATCFKEGVCFTCLQKRYLSWNKNEAEILKFKRKFYIFLQNSLLGCKKVQQKVFRKFY